MRIYLNTTSTGAAITESVKDFPLLVRLDKSNFDFADAAANGSDLRFARSDGLETSSSVDWWDPTGTGTAGIWVRVPQVNPGTTSDFITMYWNNAAATGTTDIVYGGAPVFDTANGFAGVWHLQAASAQSGKNVFLDATQDANQAEDKAGAPSDSGVLGRSQGFDGKSDYLSAASSASLQMKTAISISAWIKPSAIAGAVEAAAGKTNPIVRKGETNPNNYQFCIYNSHLSFSLDDADGSGVKGTGNLTLSKWQHVAGVWDGKNAQLFLNGEIDAQQALAKTLVPDDRPVFIGGRTTLLDGTPTGQDFFQGDIDELQISKVARSTSWMKLSYENQRPGSTLLTFEKFANPNSAPDTVTTPVSPTENYSLWSHMRKLILNTSPSGADVPGAVENFPLLVRLTSGNFDFTQALSDGHDLRFSDPDGTKLPFAIERWSSDLGKAEVWVKVPKIDGGGAQDFIQMYWGKSDAQDAQNSAAVFDTANGFRGVWHLNDGAAGTAVKGVYKDASPAGNNGDDYAAAASEEALIGKGQKFGGTSDGVRIPSNSSLALKSGFTLSAWIKGASWYNSTSDVNEIIRKGESNPNNYQLSVSNGTLAAYLDEGDEAGTRGPTKLDPGIWYHVAAAYSGDKIRLYLNGILEFEAAAKKTSISSDARPLFIGGRDSTTGDQFTGYIDEAEVANSARSSDWIKLAYESQRPDSRLIEHKGQDPQSGPVDTVLAPGGVFARDGFVVISVSKSGGGAVRLRLLPPVDPSVYGVADPSETFNLEAAVAGGSIAPVTLTVDSFFVNGRSLYKVLPGKGGSGVLWYLGAGMGKHDVLDSGTYFLGRDTVAPQLQWGGEGISDGDSSWLGFRVLDNVENLKLTTTATGLANNGDFQDQSEDLESGASFRKTFLGTSGLTPLKVTLKLRDGTKETDFPPAPSTAYLMPRKLKNLESPIGFSSSMSWELFGLPVQPSSTIHLKDLEPDGNAFAAVWLNQLDQPSLGDYRLLKDDDTVPAGQGIWLEGKSKMETLRIGDASTYSAGSGGVFTVKLTQGWNQVTCPALEKLPWPVNHADTLAYDHSVVKGLQGVDPVSGEYIDQDSLEPWHGYFVYSRVDTSIFLTPAPPTPAALMSAQIAPIQIILQPDNGAGPTKVAGQASMTDALRLGATTYAIQGLGAEDEPLAPSLHGGPMLAAVRSGLDLKTDLVGYRAGGDHVWKVGWSRGSAAGKGGSTYGHMRVTSLRLPKGTTLWAASPLRKIAQPIAMGGRLDIGDASDTLLIWAGPAQSGKSPFPGFSHSPLSQGAKWIANRGGGELQLELPTATEVRADIWSAAGTRLDHLWKPGLAPGYYSFPLIGHGRSTRAAGLMLVTVDIRDANGTRRFTFKSANP